MAISLHGEALTAFMLVFFVAVVCLFLYSFQPLHLSIDVNVITEEFPQTKMPSLLLLLLLRSRFSHVRLCETP